MKFEEFKKNNNIEHVSIEDLDISTRFYNFLKVNKINSTKDLENIKPEIVRPLRGKPYYFLLVDQLNDVLDEYGFSRLNLLENDSKETRFEEARDLPLLVFRVIADLKGNEKQGTGYLDELEKQEIEDIRSLIDLDGFNTISDLYSLGYEKFKDIFYRYEEISSFVSKSEIIEAIDGLINYFKEMGLIIDKWKK